MSEIRRTSGGVRPAGGRALVLFPGALGDFVCFYPALDVLTGRNARVTVLLRGPLGDLLPEGLGLRAGRLELPEVSRLFVEGAAAEPAVRGYLSRYDRIHSWSGAGDAVFTANLRTAARGEVYLFPFRPRGNGVRWSEYFLSCVGAGAERLRSTRMPLVPAAVEWRESLWRRHRLSGKPVLAVAPGSGAARKNWPLERFLEVCRWWRRQTKGSSLLLVGPVEEESGLDDRAFRDAALPLRGLSLSRLAAVLARCDAYAGNDSGPTHLSAALGVPTVAVFRVTDPREWTPWGPRVAVVGPRRHGGDGCAGDVSVDEVIRELSWAIPDVGGKIRR